MQMRALVAGELLAAAPGTGLRVEDPATGLVIGEVPDLGIDVLERAVDAAALVQPGWAADETARRSVLRELADVVESHSEELGTLVCAETGKSALGGRMEAVKASLSRFLCKRSVPSVSVAYR